MIRSIGDTQAHKVGVSNIPEIFEYNVNHVKPVAIIVASDGVLEFMSIEQVKNILNKYKYNQDAYGRSKEIVEKARQIKELLLLLMILLVSLPFLRKANNYNKIILNYLILFAILHYLLEKILFLQGNS